MNEKLEKIYSERALVYKCPIETFETKGVTIIREEKLRGKGYLTVAHNDVRTLIRVDPEIVFPDEDMQHITKLQPDGVIDLLESNFLMLRQQLDPLYRYYYKLSEEKISFDSELEIRQIDRSEDALLKEFFDRFSADELDDADIIPDENDPIIFGGFIDEKLVAYSSHRYPIEGVADIGVLVDKHYRGRGFGRTIVARDVNWCQENKVVPKYVVLEKNTESIRLVESLGFEQLFTVYMIHITD